jgi:hypothetical protein
MGVRAISDATGNMSGIYDSVTDIAFGPVFYTADGASDFLDWYETKHASTPDLRGITHDRLCLLVSEYEEDVARVETEPLPFPEIPF